MWQDEGGTMPENWIRQNRQFIIHNSSNLQSQKSAVHDGRLPDEFGRQKGKLSEAEFGGGTDTRAFWNNW